MNPIKILPRLGLRGRIFLPADKSISHRALILGAISTGVTTLENFPDSQDIKATVDVLRRLGVKIIRRKKGKVVIFGRGLNGLKSPKKALFISESGTTYRLLLGLLAGQCFKVKLLAGKPLSKRPMLRVIGPLRRMGAWIKASKSGKDEYPPVIIKGGNLKGINYKLPVPSAQVKSAIMLAGLYAQGKTKIIDHFKTRDHTERMFKAFRARIKLKGSQIVIEKSKQLKSIGRFYIPGDLSSAAFFIVAAIILPDSEVVLKNVSLNPSRMGALGVLKRMGARIEVCRKTKIKSAVFEQMGDILARGSQLKATKVKSTEIPSLIDEMPILMVASCFASGKTIFEGVGELRIKETDRIHSMSDNLRTMGADIKIINRAGKENIIINGKGFVKGGKLKSFGDHRTAMSSIISGLGADQESTLDDVSCINKSFPCFLRFLSSLKG